MILIAGCSDQNEQNQEDLQVIKGNHSEPEINNEEHIRESESDISTDQEDAAPHPEDFGPFHKGVHFTDPIYVEGYTDPNNVEEYRVIYEKFIEMVHAWNEKDTVRFREAFESEVSAEEHITYFIEDPPKYEFIGTPEIIDHSAENGRVNISFRYRDENGEEYRNTATYKKNEDGEWKLYLID